MTAALVHQGWTVSSTTARRLLHELGYRFQSLGKSRERTDPSNRNALVEHINETAGTFMARRQPVISVDTKTIELVAI